MRSGGFQTSKDITELIERRTETENGERIAENRERRILSTYTGLVLFNSLLCFLTSDL